MKKVAIERMIAGFRLTRAPRMDYIDENHPEHTSYLLLPVLDFRRLVPNAGLTSSYQPFLRRELSRHHSPVHFKMKTEPVATYIASPRILRRSTPLNSFRPVRLRGIDVRHILLAMYAAASGVVYIEPSMYVDLVWQPIHGPSTT